MTIKNDGLMWDRDAVINMWMHDHQNWPNFTCDTQTLASKLTDIRQAGEVFE